MRQRGFTLVELLIVIALLGILVAIAAPNFGNTQKVTGPAAQCKANLQTIEMALETYYSEKGTYPADLQTLVNEGYLKVLPECKDAAGNPLGTYYFKPATTDFIFQDGTGVNGVYGDGRAFCDYHGTLNDNPVDQDWHPEGKHL